MCVQVSGLSLWLAKLLTPLGGLPVLATITVACIIVTTVTQVASNATVVTVFLPILSPLVGSRRFTPHTHSAGSHFYLFFYS